MNVDNQNNYDLGLSDSLYFNDKNKGCEKSESIEFCDCEGNLNCITIEKDLPYIQAHEILAPVFISTTWGSEKYYSAIIKISAYKERRKTYIHINRPFKVGEIIKLEGDREAKYYIKSKSKQKDKNGNFKIELKRLDKYNMVSFDLDKLKENKKVFVKGYLKDKKN